MTKLKKTLLLIVLATLLLITCIGTVSVAFAETEDQTITETEPEIEPVPPETTDGEAEDGMNIDELAEQFKTYLTGKYGEDYDYYYNLIINKWGSIEGYLLAFGEKLPEEQQSGWNKFVGWLSEYAPIWVTIAAVIFVIVASVVGKKIFNNIVAKIVNAKLGPIVKELNLQSNATLSMLRAQKALLGDVPKFEENVKELEEAEKELTDG